MKDLGQIEFLREHPMILDRLKELSVDGMLDGFIENECATEFDGGFNWANSKEGFDFWQKVLSKENTEHFYTLYPKTEKQDTALRDEIAMRAMQGILSNSGNTLWVARDSYKFADAMLIERLK